MTVNFFYIRGFKNEQLNEFEVGVSIVLSHHVLS